MTEKINDILATKREWSKADRRKGERRKGERRKKDGSAEDRKSLADCLRAGRQRKTDSVKTWWQKLAGLIFPIFFVIIFCPLAHSYTNHDAILAVIGEAEGESQEGKEAVACAIHYRGTLQGVYGLRANRVLHHKYSKLTYNNAKRAVEMAEDQEYCEGLVHGAADWEGTSFPLPYWAISMKVVAIIGHQKFFKKG